MVGFVFTQSKAGFVLDYRSDPAFRFWIFQRVAGSFGLDGAAGAISVCIILQLLIAIACTS